MRGSADIDDLPPKHHSYRYKYFKSQEYEASHAVLTYMYTGEIAFCVDNSGDKISQGRSNAEEIYRAASQIRYPVLKKRAFNFLRDTLLVGNVMARLTRAYQTNDKDLLEMYQDFFYANWKTLTEYGIFNEFHKIADINFVFSFGKWFSWGFLNRAINDKSKLYVPEDILKTFENAQRLLAERVRVAEKEVAPN